MYYLYKNITKCKKNAPIKDKYFFELFVNISDFFLMLIYIYNINIFFNQNVKLY